MTRRCHWQERSNLLVCFVIQCPGRLHENPLDDLSNKEHLHQGFLAMTAQCAFHHCEARSNLLLKTVVGGTRTRAEETYKVSKILQV